MLVKSLRAYLDKLGVPLLILLLLLPAIYLLIAYRFSKNVVIDSSKLLEEATKVLVTYLIGFVWILINNYNEQIKIIKKKDELEKFLIDEIKKFFDIYDQTKTRSNSLEDLVYGNNFNEVFIQLESTLKRLIDTFEKSDVSVKNIVTNNLKQVVPLYDKITDFHRNHSDHKKIIEEIESFRKIYEKYKTEKIH